MSSSSALAAALLLLPATLSAGGSALEQLRQAAGVEAPAVPSPSGTRFCAFTGGLPAVQGRVHALALTPPEAAAAEQDTAVPVEDAGVLRPEAGAKARALLQEMLAQSPASIAASLRAHRVFLVIIPQNKKLTDLPQFSSLRGVRLPGGRVWDDVRGVGFVSQDDGTVAVAAGEENFLEGALPDHYPKGFLLAHEFSHAVQGYGLSPAEGESISQAYQDREAAHLEFPSHYAETDDREYFAVSASSFFDRRMSGRDPEREIGWIRRNDATMFALLGRAYGTPRPLWTGPGLP
ncbi:MAG TPA: hypothetical protein VN915_05760 [Elusimicrobiota bacterium]|nr:hypothetical protein [Elusimicrobiota bacterium]